MHARPTCCLTKSVAGSNSTHVKSNVAKWSNSCDVLLLKMILKPHTCTARHGAAIAQLWKKFRPRAQFDKAPLFRSTAPASPTWHLPSCSFVYLFVHFLSIPSRRINWSFNLYVYLRNPFCLLGELCLVHINVSYSCPYSSYGQWEFGSKSFEYIRLAYSNC